MGIRAAAITQSALAAQGAPYIIGNQGVPMIVVGSGTMANNGALTLTTALAVSPAITSAYVYLPAGAIASGVPAAPTWYYALFSSTTAATVYNNTYTSGTPIIPPLPTAFVTTGPGAYTGVSSAVTAYQLSIPGNILGLNGGLQVWPVFSMTNSSSNKTVAVSYGALSLLSAVETTVASYTPFALGFKNGGQTGMQYISAVNNGTATGTAITSSTIDTTSAQTLSVSLTNATPASNNLGCLDFTAIVFPSVQ